MPNLSPYRYFFGPSLYIRSSTLARNLIQKVQDDVASSRVNSSPVIGREIQR